MCGPSLAKRASAAVSKWPTTPNAGRGAGRTTRVAPGISLQVGLVERALARPKGSSAGSPAPGAACLWRLDSSSAGERNKSPTDAPRCAGPTLSSLAAISSSGKLPAVLEGRLDRARCTTPLVLKVAARLVIRAWNVTGVQGQLGHRAEHLKPGAPIGLPCLAFQ